MTSILNATGSGVSITAGATASLSVQINGTTAAAFNTNGLFFRNRVINGDMRIDQRNAGAAVTVSGAYPVDRFFAQNTTDGAFSAQQDSSAPTGFVNSVKMTTTTADATLTAAQNFAYRQNIEGTNVADLAWGTANALPITLSFWARSSLTGTFGGSIKNAANDRSYPFTYSISVADTWEYKTVTIPGETSGSWLTTTGLGIQLTFGLGVGPDRSGTAGAWNSNNNLSATGAVSVIGTLNATWYVTGVQLETGSVATPFERRPYGTELMLCQRYYYRLTPGVVSGLLGAGYVVTTLQAVGQTNFPVPMRTRPTALEQSGTANQYEISHANTVTTCSSVPTYQGATTANSANTFFTVSSGLTVGQGCYLRTDATNGTTSYLGWSAEL